MLCLTLGGLILGQKSYDSLDPGNLWCWFRFVEGFFFGFVLCGHLLTPVWDLSINSCNGHHLWCLPISFLCGSPGRPGVIRGAGIHTQSLSGIPLPCLPPRIVPVCTGCTSAPPQLPVALHQFLLSASGCQKFERKKKVPMWKLVNELNRMKHCVLLSKRR